MKISACFLLCFCFCALSFTGCGGGETKVIPPPAADEDASAMEGVEDDEYNKEMEKSMNQQGG
jgi:hypothetical protein